MTETKQEYCQWVVRQQFSFAYGETHVLETTCDHIKGVAIQEVVDMESSPCPFCGESIKMVYVPQRNVISF